MNNFHDDALPALPPPLRVFGVGQDEGTSGATVAVASGFGVMTLLLVFAGGWLFGSGRTLRASRGRG